MPTPNELFSHPLRWAGKHLAFYALASAVAGAVFVAGSALYVRFGLAPIRIEPNIHAPASPAPVVPPELRIWEWGFPEPSELPAAIPIEEPSAGAIAQALPSRMEAINPDKPDHDKLLGRDYVLAYPRGGESLAFQTAWTWQSKRSFPFYLDDPNAKNALIGWDAALSLSACPDASQDRPGYLGSCDQTLRFGLEAHTPLYANIPKSPNIQRYNREGKFPKAVRPTMFACSGVALIKRAETMMMMETVEEMQRRRATPEIQGGMATAEMQGSMATACLRYMHAMKSSQAK